MLMLDLYSMSADPNPKTILRIDVVLHRTGLKRTMLYDLILKGKFPRQVSLGARAVGWFEDEVEHWIRDRQATKLEQEGRIRNDELTTHALKASAIAKETTPKTGQVNENTTVNAPAPTRRNGRGTRRAPAPIIKGTTTAQEAMSSSDELRCLRDENARLKRLIADLIIKNDLLQSSMQGKAAAF